MSLDRFQTGVIELLNDIADKIDGSYKSIKGVFSMYTGIPPVVSYQTFTDIRTNNLDRRFVNFEAGTTATGFYISFRVYSDLLPEPLSNAPFTYKFDKNDIEIIIGPGYDTEAYSSFSIKKTIETTTNPDDTLYLQIHSKTPENFGANTSTGDPINVVPFEIRFYNLVPYNP